MQALKKEATFCAASKKISPPISPLSGCSIKQQGKKITNRPRPDQAFRRQSERRCSFLSNRSAIDFFCLTFFFSCYLPQSVVLVVLVVLVVFSALPPQPLQAFCFFSVDFIFCDKRIEFRPSLTIIM